MAEQDSIKPNIIGKCIDINPHDFYENMMKELWYITAVDSDILASKLNVLIELCKSPHGAKILVNCPWWLPHGIDVSGETIEFHTVLGFFLHINIPYRSILNLLDRTDLYETITYNCSMLQDGLAKVFDSLLGHTCIHENVLVYLAQVINSNKILDDEHSCSTVGMLLNLSGVMLRLCEVYLDKDLMCRDEIDIRYVSKGRRVDFSGLTTVHQVSDNRMDCGEESGYSFRCELFFMTARVLHLGLVQQVYYTKPFAKSIILYRQQLSDMMPSHPQQTYIKLEMLLHFCLWRQKRYELQFLNDKLLIKRALSFYRLMVVWLISLVGGPKLPLPVTCPEEFACVPEHFVDDLVILLRGASSVQIELDEGMMEDFINFIVMFMASPEYIRNPHLRVKMVKFLHLWMVQKDNFSSSEAFYLMKPTSVSKFLVRSLLKAYIDMELLRNMNHFLDYRMKIVEQLSYLWKVVSHHDEWIQIANNEEKGLYLKFLKFLIEDTICRLDHSFEIIHAPEPIACSYYNCVHMALALENVNLLADTSQHITSPLLLPDIVEEVVNMLNYILSQLHKLFRLKDTSVCGPNPIKLLEKIVEVYVNLDRGDNYNVLPATIVKTYCTYDQHFFTERILEIIGRNKRQKKMVEEFVELGYKAKVEAIAEAALGEIPEEFLDPIQSTLMKDPVVLPSSKVNIDRAVISRHLLSSENDPFTRSYLNVDMLTPNAILKGKIEEFIRDKLLNHNDMVRQYEMDTT